MAIESYWSLSTDLLLSLYDYLVFPTWSCNQIAPTSRKRSENIQNEKLTALFLFFQKMLPSIAKLVLLSALAVTVASDSLEDCDPEMVGFELVTGYVFSAPTDLLDSLPGTLMLTDCLESCQSNDSCQAVNYETGLCVLFSSNADTYPGMQNSLTRGSHLIGNRNLMVKL